MFYGELIIFVILNEVRNLSFFEMRCFASLNMTGKRLISSDDLP